MSEPPEDEQDGDCEDVGVALVNVRDILRNRKDVIEEDIDSMWFLYCYLTHLEIHLLFTVIKNAFSLCSKKMV